MTMACLKCLRPFSTDKKFVRLCPACHKYLNRRESSMPVHGIVLHTTAAVGDHKENRMSAATEVIYTIPDGPVLSVG